MNKLLENKGVLNGLLFGGLAVIIGLVLYFVNKSYFLSPSLRFILSLALPLTFMIRAAVDKRKELGGFGSFAEIIKPTYLTLILGSLIFSIFQFIVMSSDSELLEIQQKIAIESLDSISGLAGLSEESIAEVRNMEAGDFKPTIKALLFGISKNFMVGFIFAVIIALIVQRKKLSSEQS